MQHVCPSIARRGSAATMLGGIVFCLVIGQSSAFTRMRGGVVAKPSNKADVEVAETQPHARVTIEVAGTQPHARAAKPCATTPQPCTTTQPCMQAPKPCDIVADVKSKLADDKRALSKVSSELLSVQTNVKHHSNSLIGKVLDLETARDVRTHHKSVEAENSKLKDKISKLNAEVGGLSSTLSDVHKEFLGKQRENSLSEGELHVAIEEDETVVRNLNDRLTKEHAVQHELKKLEKMHRNLGEAAERTAKRGEKALSELAVTRRSSHDEASKHDRLRTQLKDMNKYSLDCHSRINKAATKLALDAQSNDTQATTMALKQTKKAAEASEERLLAEGALLVSEVKKVESAGLEGVTEIKDMRKKLKKLEDDMKREMKELEAKLHAERARLQKFNASLVENSEAAKKMAAEKNATDANITDLKKKLHKQENPVILANLTKQNEHLQAKLNHAHLLDKHSKRFEATAVAKVHNASAELEAAKKALKLAHDGIAKAHTDGAKKLAEATKQGAENRAKAKAKLEKAQAKIAAKCKTKWDAHWKVKRSRLRKCKRMETEKKKLTAKYHALKSKKTIKKHMSRIGKHLKRHVKDHIHKHVHKHVHGHLKKHLKKHMKKAAAR